MIALGRLIVCLLFVSTLGFDPAAEGSPDEAHDMTWLRPAPRSTAWRAVRTPSSPAGRHDDRVANHSGAEARDDVDRRVARCRVAIESELRALAGNLGGGRSVTRGRRFIDSACEGVPARALDGEPLAPFRRACGYAIDPDGQIGGEALGSCTRRVALARFAHAGIGPAIPRPNIIVIVADDQRWDTIDATYSPVPGSTRPAMPATHARLAGEGLTFTQAVVTTPICGPSRGSLLSGRYAHLHRMVANDGQRGPLVFDDSDTVATRLSAAGYRTGFLGKYANGFTEVPGPGGNGTRVPPGWDDFRVFDHRQEVPHQGFRMVDNGVARDYTGAGAPYATDLLTSLALEFIDVGAAQVPVQPFLLWMSLSTPHFPWQPAPRHLGAFGHMSWTFPPNFYEADVSDKPEFIRSIPIPDLLRIRGQTRKWQTQLAMQLSADEMVAALLDHLEARGIDEDTLVVYTSDNGEAWGEHRWNSKGCPFEECLRVPMIVRYPRLIGGARRESGVVSNVDLMPTLAGLAGADSGAATSGLDLGGVLRGDAVPAARDVLFEVYSSAPLTFAGIRSERFKYIRYLGGGESLYDLALDPFELDDWKASPDHAATLEAMRTRLAEIWPGFEAISAL